jgi:hypothetical protein
MKKKYAIGSGVIYKNEHWSIYWINNDGSYQLIKPAIVGYTYVLKALPENFTQYIKTKCTSSDKL